MRAPSRNTVDDVALAFCKTATSVLVIKADQRAYRRRSRRGGHLPSEKGELRASRKACRVHQGSIRMGSAAPPSRVRIEGAAAGLCRISVARPRWRRNLGHYGTATPHRQPGIYRGVSGAGARTARGLLPRSHRTKQSIARGSMGAMVECVDRFPARRGDAA